MLVLSHKSEVEALHESGVAVTVGSFDGVHRGHKHLVGLLKSEARGGKTAVLTFDPHPEKVLSAHPPLQLFDKQDQIEMFRAMGVDYLFFLPFDKEMAKMEAALFASQYIFELFKPASIVVGYDFAFGAARSGNYELLKSMAPKYSAKVYKVNPLLEGSEIVSSSSIRKAILEGKIEKANQLLGRAFYIQGHVKEGRRIGRTIGVPTANLALKGEMAPGPGVYHCTVIFGEKRFKGVCNVGTNPTVTESKDLKIEVHILDFNQDIYNKSLRIEFHRKLREEMRFPSLEALKAQIAADIALTKTLV